MQNTMSRNLYGALTNPHTGQPLQSSQMYNQIQTSNIHPEHTHTSMDNLTDNFGSINLRNAALMGQAKAASLPMSNSDPSFNAMMGSQSNAPMLVQLSDGTFVYSGVTNGAQGNYHQYSNGYNMTTQPAQYQQANYHNKPQTRTNNGPQTPHNNPWVPAQGVQQLPELVAPRRSSWSSNEEQSPQTPLDGYQQGVLITGHSPTTWSTTPSPIQAQFPYNQQVGKAEGGVYAYFDFWKWTQMDPAIPPPVPAIHSGQDGGRGSLDKILDNRNGTTNVYIRGLQPNTTDEMLEGYGRRFGAIASQKAIIEMSTKACKGYGFIMYHNYDDAENCIRAFYFLGYEAKFAKESHNQRLKALSDSSNTNLYVSNLPRLMVEANLEALFQEVFPLETHAEYKPTSSKILKDSNGISRGVGFARFRTPEICQQIIDAFNNKTIGEGKLATTLQLRYADTDEQKKLKTFTAEKRQFKTNEYNEVVYGPGSPWTRLYSPVSAPASYYSPTQTRLPSANLPWGHQSQSSSISPQDSGYSQSILGHGQIPGATLQRQSVTSEAEIGPALPRHATHIKIESPSVAAAAKKAASEKIEEEVPDTDSCATSDEDTLVCKSKSGKSAAGDAVTSPTKARL